MSGGEVIFHGQEQAFRAMESNAARIGESARSVALATADRAANIVRGVVPYESGGLRASVTTLLVEKGASVAYDGSAAYAGWIDFGGTRGRAYVASGRYLFPRARAEESAFVGALKTDASRQIASYPWPKA